MKNKILVFKFKDSKRYAKYIDLQPDIIPANLFLTRTEPFIYRTEKQEVYYKIRDLNENKTYLCEIIPHLTKKGNIKRDKKYYLLN